MFGYIMPERAHLYMKDLDLYRNFYCGICKSMGRQFSQKARFTINYDITFLAVLVHNYLGVDVEFEKLKCVTKPFNKTRQMVKGNDLTDKFASINVILAYFKLQDDEIDDKKSKIARKMFESSKRKADKVTPNISDIVEKHYENLRQCEKQNLDSLDRVADCFATMMKEIGKEIVQDKFTEEFGRLCYFIGKWVYLIDALDDFDDDVKDGNFNPFKAKFKDILSKTELLTKFEQDITFTMATTAKSIISAFESVKFAFNKDLISNIIQRGIPLMTRGVLKGEQCNRNYLKF